MVGRLAADTNVGGLFCAAILADSTSMLHAAQMHEVRMLVEQTFHGLGAAPDSTPLESILVRDGYYCGRRFDCDGMQAVWFVEENEIKFYGRDGSVQCVCRPSAPRHGQPQHRRVA
jgi:hypothetical protein